MKSWICLSLLFSSLASLDGEPRYFIAIQKNEGKNWTALETYTPLLPPEGKFYADPFLFKDEGLNYLFFEEFDGQKGVISYVTLDQEGAISEPKLALELPIHLSFPYVFQDKGDIYMVPETYRARSVSLYKGVGFPHHWEVQRVLIQGEHFSDPILFQYGGYYWLFTAVHRDRLCIYYALDLEGPFLPHPINRRRLRGRNAGPIFYIDGKPIRPTMDCRLAYGRSMILKEIVCLTPSKFVEREIAVIEPTWAKGLDGTHTYCQGEDYTVYDGSFNQ